MKSGTAFNVVISKADVIVDKPLEKDYFEKFLLANELTGECHEDELDHITTLMVSHSTHLVLIWV